MVPCSVGAVDKMDGMDIIPRIHEWDWDVKNSMDIYHQGGDGLGM